MPNSSSIDEYDFDERLAIQSDSTRREDTMSNRLTHPSNKGNGHHNFIMMPIRSHSESQEYSIVPTLPLNITKESILVQQNHHRFRQIDGSQNLIVEDR